VGLGVSDFAELEKILLFAPPQNEIARKPDAETPATTAVTTPA
jgi:hypothetical protein